MDVVQAPGVANLLTVDVQTGQESFRYRYRWAIFGLCNFTFMIVVSVLSAFDHHKGHNPALYLILLLLLFSAPMILVKKSNGPFCLLVVAGPIFFMFYGLNDLLSYLGMLPSYYRGSPGQLLTLAEIALLGGFACLFAGYSLVVLMFGNVTPRWAVRDWQVNRIVLVGLASVFIGLYATWQFQLTENRDSVSAIAITLQVLARMLEPVGAVLLSYAAFKGRSKFLWTVVLVIGVLKLPIGIALNSKEIGISFFAILLMTKWIYDGRIPVRWLVIALVVISVYFPISYAYRATIGTRQISIGESVANFSENLEKANKIKNKQKGNSSGIASVAGRTDLKSLMVLIEAKTGSKVKFQKGQTLVELPLVFVPRLIWPDKPSVSVGRLFNREFRISESPDTYISTSFIGELFWNFGWLGTLVGMFVIGAFWGGIGCAANVQHMVNVTRILILISAIYALVLRFEAGIAQQHILFLRSLLIILFLHLIFREREISNS